MKVHIETYGCTANKADADTIKNLLSNNYRITNFEESDLVIILTCGVKGPIENKIIERLRKIKGKKVIIAGCLPRMIGNNLKNEFPNYSLIGVDQVQDIENICKRGLNGEIIEEINFQEKKTHSIKRNQ